MALSPEHVATWFARRASSSEIVNTPSPHSTLGEAIFPPLFEEMVAMLPSTNELTPVHDIAGYSRRCVDRFGVTAGRYNCWIRRQRRLADSEGLGESFRIFCDAITSPAVIEQLVQTYCVPLQLCDTGDTFHLQLRLVVETGISWLKPHLDTPEKILTVVFYLAFDEEVGSVNGTTLFSRQPLGDNVADVSAVVVPFQPNSALILPRTEQSWHGVPPHPCGKGRYTLHLYVTRRAQRVREITYESAMAHQDAAISVI